MELLPSETLVRIFTHLDVHFICAVNSVSHALYTASRSPYLWRLLCSTDFVYIPSRIQRLFFTNPYHCYRSLARSTRSPLCNKVYQQSTYRFEKPPNLGASDNIDSLVPAHPFYLNCSRWILFLRFPQRVSAPCTIFLVNDTQGFTSNSNRSEGKECSNEDGELSKPKDNLRPLVFFRFSVRRGSGQTQYAQSILDFASTDIQHLSLLPNESWDLDDVCMNVEYQLLILNDMKPKGCGTTIPSSPYRSLGLWSRSHLHDDSCVSLSETFAPVLSACQQSDSQLAKLALTAVLFLCVRGRIFSDRLLHDGLFTALSYAVASSAKHNCFLTCSIVDMLFAHEDIVKKAVADLTVFVAESILSTELEAHNERFLRPLAPFYEPTATSRLARVFCFLSIALTAEKCNTAVVQESDLFGYVIIATASAPLSALPFVLCSLRHFVRHDAYHSRIQQSTLCQDLVRLLSCDSEAVVCGTLDVLSVLMKVPLFEHSFLEIDASAPLIELIASSSRAILSRAATVIAILSAQENWQPHLVDNGVLPLLLQMISDLLDLEKPQQNAGPTAEDPGQQTDQSESMLRTDVIQEKLLSSVFILLRVPTYASAMIGCGIVALLSRHLSDRQCCTAVRQLAVGCFYQLAEWDMAGDLLASDQLLSQFIEMMVLHCEDLRIRIDLANLLAKLCSSCNDNTTEKCMAISLHKKCISVLREGQYFLKHYNADELDSESTHSNRLMTLDLIKTMFKILGTLCRLHLVKRSLQQDLTVLTSLLQSDSMEVSVASACLLSAILEDFDGATIFITDDTLFSFVSSALFLNNALLGPMLSLCLSLTSLEPFRQKLQSKVCLRLTQLSLPNPNVQPAIALLASKLLSCLFATPFPLTDAEKPTSDALKKDIKSQLCSLLQKNIVSDSVAFWLSLTSLTLGSPTHFLGMMQASIERYFREPFAPAASASCVEYVSSLSFALFNNVSLANEVLQSSPTLVATLCSLFCHTDSSDIKMYSADILIYLFSQKPNLMETVLQPVVAALPMGDAESDFCAVLYLLSSVSSLPSNPSASASVDMFFDKSESAWHLFLLSAASAPTESFSPLLLKTLYAASLHSVPRAILLIEHDSFIQNILSQSSFTPLHVQILLNLIRARPELIRRLQERSVLRILCQQLIDSHDLFEMSVLAMSVLEINLLDSTVNADTAAFLGSHLTRLANSPSSICQFSAISLRALFGGSKSLIQKAVISDLFNSLSLSTADYATAQNAAMCLHTLHTRYESISREILLRQDSLVSCHNLLVSSNRPNALRAALFIKASCLSVFSSDAFLPAPMSPQPSVFIDSARSLCHL